MTYNKFKRELYANILQREEAAGKQIKLLERQCICTDRDTLRLVEICSTLLYGRPEVYVREDMLCIVWEEWRILRMLYWHTLGLYERFLQEGWQGVLPEIIFKMQIYGRQMEPPGHKAFESRFGRQILRPLNFRRNREELKNAVYWRFGNIALVLHDYLYESGEDHMSMRHSRDAIRREGLPEEVVMVNALLQTRAMLPPRLCHGGDIRRFFSGQAGVFMPGEQGEPIIINKRDREEGMQGYRLTNTRRSGGAAAFFYPGVPERLGELLDGDYYVAFAGIHEAVIHPVRYKGLDEMKTAVRRYYAVLDENEALSDRVYRYSARQKRLFEV